MADRRLVGLIAPHIARASQIHHQMAAVSTQKHWAWSALDRLRVGVILLDGQGRLLHMNRVAERLTSGGNGFIVGRNGLELPQPTETVRLRRLIADAAALAEGRRTEGGGCLRVSCKVGTTLQFQVIPLPKGFSERPWNPSQADSCVAVFVSVPGAAHLPRERVAAMYGLTRAEARLASLLADGIDLEEVAETLAVSIQTVRSQLKSIFSKTGVTRQAELVALLLTDMLTDQVDGPLEAIR
jgi:DNA-binding CsgD family transcriptional regulator